MNDNDQKYRLLLQYLTEGLPEAEQVALLEWVNSSHENKELYFQVKDIVDQEKLQQQPIAPAAEAWAQLLQRRAVMQPPTPIALNAGTFYTYWRYAAAVIFIVALSAGVYFYQYTKTQQFITVAVAAQQPVKKVQLPDNSTVWLKPGSSLSYSQDFNQKERNIQLTGEAFFEVVKVLDASGRRKPFTVTSSHFSIAVLGTSFSVNDSAATPTVIVRSGKVRTTAGQTSRVLKAGDRAVIKENTLVLDKVNPTLLTGWTTGEYEFNHTSINEIKDLLEANYGQQVDIACSACFEDVSLSGRVYAENEQAFLEILRVMLPAEIKTEATKIIIKPTNPTL